ncbi:hypothetical protein BSL78_24693 [Apostichopus japonicus]|uniref:Uncharacterized protein n=1 Tax=Stichopus japonicus TaxID=307972 RepID=A0A2G8JRW9_STIJA|nr:hypothetical protein BSL78_24693 [Apostichopus japonicus]
MAGNDVDHWQFNEDICILFDAIVATFDNYSNQDEAATFSNSRNMREVMRETYTNDMSNRISDRPDYSDKLMRWTYTYTYLPRHVHLVYAALMKAYTPEHMESFEKLKEQPIVCCVGGGPNIDALGLCIFLRAVGCYGTLTTKVCVLDKYDDWRHTWEDMKQQLSCEYQSWMPQTEWAKFDMCSSLYPRAFFKVKSFGIINEADIITMIKSLSTVASSAEKMKLTVDQLMKKMKRGALLLFIDYAKSNAVKIVQQALSSNRSSHRVLHDELITDALTREIYSGSAETFTDRMEDQPVLGAGQNIMLLIHRFA